MTIVRKPLFEQLHAAWDAAIEQDYCTQRINSERSLQASFWAQLNRILPASRRRMFIEPRIAPKMKDGSTAWVPDVVVCNTRAVIGVVELKYQPRTLPSYAKDVMKLAHLAEHGSGLSIANERYRGQTVDPREYTFARQVLFVWAGVHSQPKESFRSPAVPLLSAGHSALDGCFGELHAETVHGSRPHVFARHC